MLFDKMGPYFYALLHIKEQPHRGGNGHEKYAYSTFESKNDKTTKRKMRKKRWTVP